MKPELKLSPPAARSLPRVLFGVTALPLLIAWGGGVVHPILDWASIPGAWMAGLPSAFGPLGFLGVLLLAIAHITIRAERHPRTIALVSTTLPAAGAVAVLAVIASGAAASRPASWLPILLAIGVLSRKREDATDPWDLPEAVLPGATVVLWGSAICVRPWGDGLLGSAVEDQLSALTDAVLVSAIPLLPLVPIGVVAWWLSRRLPPRRRGALVGVTVALLLEKTFGFGDNWISIAAIGAVFGAWPPSYRGERPIVLLAIPLLAGVFLGGARLGLVERWNCTAGTLAAADNPEYIWFHTESDGVSMAVAPLNSEALLVLRADGSFERLISGTVGGRAEVEPPGGILVTPPLPEMPIARLVSLPNGLRVEWWDQGTMQITAQRDVGVDCTPVSGTMELETFRIWAVCADEARMVLVDRGDDPPQIWDVADDPRSVRLRGDALSTFFSGPMSHAEIRRIPALDDRIASRRLGPWAEGMADSPQRVAVGRGPAGHLEIFGTPHRDAVRGGSASYADELAVALDSRTDTVRVGTWPGVPFRARIGEPRNSQGHGRGWYESMFVTSPVDARVTLVDLDVTWHQRSIPIGAPLRSVWVNADDGTLFGMNRCGVFSLRFRTTFPWDP